jgi:DNA invertase Pin-like site-specific DNA recombinase
MRVSVVGDREGERFVSPDEQRARIEAACKRDGLMLIDVREELDVRGGKALSERIGLSAAVEAIESGRADVIAAAYFDRLFRSLSTQAEVIERVEGAGGSLLAVDVGQVTGASAGQWLSSTMMGAVSEYFRRSSSERSAEGQARAVARGATPWARVQLGYIRREDGTLTPDPPRVQIVRRAFKMRREDKSLREIRTMLAAEGVERSFRGVQVMLASRVYLGEIHFGKMVNLNAHQPIIDPELWDAVQAKMIPRGPRPKGSDRLLARLGVLRCGSCGSRLSAMKLPRQNDYPIYRCASTSDCDRHVTISAKIAEDVVSDAVRKALLDVEGRASGAESARKAAHALESAQDELDAALRSFAAAGLADEPAAVERLSALRQARDGAQDELRQIGLRTDLAINGDQDWGKLTNDERRALIAALVESATVAPKGRGAERMAVRLR